MTTNDFAIDPWDKFDLDPEAIRALAQKIYEDTGDVEISENLMARADEIALVSEGLLYTYDELLGEEVADEEEVEDWSGNGFTVVTNDED